MNHKIEVDSVKGQAMMHFELIITREQEAYIRRWLFMKLLRFAVWVGGFGSVELRLK